MRETFRFLSMVAWMEPESETSNRYRVSVGYHGDPEDFMSVSNRKKAEKYILDCIREEALTFADDDPDNDDREALLDMVRTAKSLDEMPLILNSQTFHDAACSGPYRAQGGLHVHR